MSDDFKLPENQDDEDFLWAKERECLLLLLESRVLLSHLVTLQQKKVDEELDGKAKRRELDRRLRGDLNCMEIGDLLKREPGGDDMDYNSELARLKRLVIQEIKKNHVLDGQLAQMDLKIALMITNKGTTQDMGAKKKEAWLAKLAAGQKKKEAGDKKEKYELPAGHLEAYGELFYLLQTEPKYLAKSLFLLQPTQVEAFLDSTLITLFGEAFSPREEFLILSLFGAAMEQEIRVVKNAQEFLTPDSVVPKLLVAYNRRMQGMIYLRSVLPDVIKIIQNDKDLNLELNPVMCASELGKTVTSEEQALQNSDVTKELEKRSKALASVCGKFLDALYNTMDKLPYGLRWICKAMRELCEKQLPQTNKDDILRLTGYFVYYRFVNVALLNPESYKVVTKEMGMKERKNLMVVGKVLQKAFNLKLFGKAEKSLQSLNGFLEKQRDPMIKYFNQIVQVTDPEDFLQVDQYMELTQKEKPTIYINLSEIITIHKLIYEKLDNMTSADDPLRVILKDLGPPPEDFDSADSRDIQLTLQNRFKQELKEEEANLQLYAETKDLMIPILRAIPTASSVHEMTLMETLDYGYDWAKKEKQSQIAEHIDTVRKNLAVLAKAKLVSEEDDYQSFVKDLAMEVANRATIRERQKKEIARLKAVLAKLQKQSTFTEEQLVEYDKYLQDALKKQYEGKKPKALHKPQKFSYKKMAQMGVVVDSEIPEKERKGCKLVWHVSDTFGVFDCDVNMKQGHIEPMSFALDELLSRHYNGVEELEQPKITFNVNMTLYLINKYILT